MALGAFLDAAPPAPEEMLWVEADLARLAAVRAERARMAEQFFATHAEQWDALRSLHAPEAQVEAAMAALLGNAPLGRLIDIGTGTGRIATLFAPRADQVLGVDRSAEMLRPRARQARRGGQGDFYELPAADGLGPTPPFSTRCCIMPRRPSA